MGWIKILDALINGYKICDSKIQYARHGKVGRYEACDR